MTLGTKIKKARIEAGLTQKDLADRLSVAFQTVSKWESGTTEPDLATLRAMARILKVSLEYLVSDDATTPSKPIGTTRQLTSPMSERRRIGTCVTCHKTIMDDEVFHRVERKTPSGVKETVVVCDACFKRHEEQMERRAKEIEQSLDPKAASKKNGLFHKITDRNDKKPLIWGIVIGILAFIAALVLCIVYYSYVGIGWSIAAPLLAGYGVTSTIYCLFTVSYISDVFEEVASWSIRFPGLIFAWDLDGFLWLIGMKILFFVLGMLFSIGVFLLALSISAFLSVFSFVPLLIYNKTHY